MGRSQMRFKMNPAGSGAGTPGSKAHVWRDVCGLGPSSEVGGGTTGHLGFFPSSPEPGIPITGTPHSDVWSLPQKHGYSTWEVMGAVGWRLRHVVLIAHGFELGWALASPMKWGLLLPGVLTCILPLTEWLSQGMEVMCHLSLIVYLQGISISQRKLGHLVLASLGKSTDCRQSNHCTVNSGFILVTLKMVIWLLTLQLSFLPSYLTNLLLR